MAGVGPAAARQDTVVAEAWCRVDLAGGTLDIWPIGLQFPGAATVNVALDLGVEVTVGPSRAGGGYEVELGEEMHRAGDAQELVSRRPTELPGVVLQALAAPPCHVRVRSASPRGGGLGASSAMTVALIAALDAFTGRPRREVPALAHLARDLEARLMRLPTGTQDHYPAALGGALHLRYGPGEEAVERLDVDLAALGRHLVVAYSGESHFSAATNWQVIRRCLDGDPEIRHLFAAIAEIASAVAQAVAVQDWERAGRLMSREWESRRQLAEGVSTPRLEELLTVAAEGGAWGGKACGAGGGGCLAFLVPAGQRQEVAARLARAGADVLGVTPQRLPMQLRVG